ncbi:hypothetical protein BAUR9175_03734, partial [Brevibacterium aurantiacum]
ETVAVGDGIRTTLARGSEPTYTIIVLTDSLLLEHDAAGSGGDLGKHLWKRPVRDRDTTSCPHVMFALEPERTAKNQPNRWIKAKALRPITASSGVTWSTSSAAEVASSCGSTPGSNRRPTIGSATAGTDALPVASP